MRRADRRDPFHDRSSLPSLSLRSLRPLVWMYRVSARIRALVSLLLLVAGQLGLAASARAATCPRAAVRRAAEAAPRLVAEHPDRAPAPPGDLPAAPSAGCGFTAALPERTVEHPLPLPAGEDAPPRAASPPGDPFAVSFFRPPRPS